MTRHQFRNALCLLRSIDKHELIESSVIASGDDLAWRSFLRDPVLWFVHADDATADRLWRLIEGRMNPTLHAARAS